MNTSLLQMIILKNYFRKLINKVNTTLNAIDILTSFKHEFKHIFYLFSLLFN